MGIVVDEKLFKQAIKRLKDYLKVVDMEDGIERLIDLLPDTEELIEELEGEL